MRKTNLYAIAVLAFGVLATGCGGGSGSSTALPSAPGAPAHGLAPSSAAKFVISIPARSSSSTGRIPAYVSASTASVGIVETDNGGTPLPAVTANVTPGSPNCTASGTGTTCSISVPANPGNDSFAVSTYDAANGGGHVLSTGTIAATIAPGVANTTVPVVLGGVIGTLSATLADPYAAIGRTTMLNISAKDAAGNNIIGTFDNPVTIAPISGLTFSQMSANNSSDASHVQVGYALGYPTGATSISVSGDGHTATATLTPGSGIFYYNNPSTPAYDVTGFGAVMGPDGNFYYGDLGPLVCQNYFCSAATGGVARLNPATGTFTDVQLAGGATQTFFSSDGALWVSQLTAGKIAYFAPGAFPAFTQITVPLSGTQAGSPRSFAQDANGNVWFTDQRTHRVGKIPIASPMTTPVMYSVPPGPAGTTGYNASPQGIAFGADANLYVADHNNGVIDVINPATGATTNQMITPEQQAVGITDTTFPRFIVRGSDNKLYFSQSGSYNNFTHGWLDSLTSPSTFGNLPLPFSATPDSLAAGASVIYASEFGYGGIDKADLTTGKVVTWPLTQNLTNGGPMPNGIAVNPADNSAWFSCYGSQTVGGVVGGPPIAQCAGHAVLTSAWSVWPGGPINLNGTGSQAAQLIGLMEAGNSGPYTTSSSNTAVCTAGAPSTQFDHNFLITGVAVGTCTVSVTDAHARTTQVTVNVTQTTGTVQSVGRKTTGGSI